MKMKRDEKTKFFPKKCLRTLKPARSISPKCFEKNPFRTNYSSIFSSKVQNLTVFSIIHMIRIRFFGPQELIQKHFRAVRESTTMRDDQTYCGNSQKYVLNLESLQKQQQKHPCSGKPDQKIPLGPVIWMVMQRNVWSDIAGWRKKHTSNWTKL